MLQGIQLELLVHGDHYPAVIERVLAAQRSVWIASAIWRGAECEGYRMRDECPMPLSEIERAARAPAETSQLFVRLRP